MATPNFRTDEQRQAWTAGFKLAADIYKPNPTDKECDEIELQEDTLCQSFNWSLRGWVINGFETAWDALASKDPATR